MNHRKRLKVLVTITRDGPAWLVVCRKHSWLHATLVEALADAQHIAKTFAMSLVIILRTMK
jgi:hypothetical protein